MKTIILSIISFAAFTTAYAALRDSRSVDWHADGKRFI